ncbi:zinc finger protein with KRAB and SCAN domains 2 [Rousettus aegyptiacus]|uniref:Zinc finger with KRAB and SCAN domains 2 n=1 Tax=Rousettus aegyptiacus TaxID=9407 RepID=A0A7J8F5N0_ROUAE|nr:zinc finger protein with KRAB and SCAN domains 2 [Rousettus aegyptiacus]KAF6442881.1 zinc finger with KRAB and SCAN domains 2 [Rousettus aegyptiacus]
MDPEMDAPLEVEGYLIMKVEKDPGWVSEPALQGPRSSESESFRRCFRQFCYEDVSGPHEAFSKLWELCCRWLKPEMRSKEQILELLVIEQFLAILPEKIQAWAQKQCPKSGEEAVALVMHLERETGRRRQQVSSPVPSEKQAPLGAAWDVVVFRPETQPGVVSREEAGSLHSGLPEQSNQKRERRPFSKNARAPPWAPAPAEEWTAADQEVRSVRLPIGSQRPVKDVHVARGFPYRKSVRQVPAHRGLFQEVREESAEDVVSLGGAVSASNGMARLEHRRAPWTAGPHSSHSRSGLRSSHIKEASACVVQGPARGAGKAWREQQQWGLEDEKVAGVHWSYEETKTFLAILRESRFYETLQACPRNSQVYGAVAEWLRECGFLRTPEQCRTKFKSLQKSYRKARSGHVLESCAFFEDMDALLNPAAHTSSAGKPKETASLPRPKRVGTGAEEQISLVEEEEAAEESGGEEMGIEFLRKAGLRAAPVLFQNLSGVHWGYEETKTFLDILRETRFYEALQACHRKSKLYGAVAERLRECGFLRTPEQCRTKFKSLQKSYRKARSGHVLEPCAFYREMDALINARAPGPTLGVAPCPSGQEREGMGMEPQDAAGWEPEPPSPAATAGDSGSERLSGEEAVPEPERQGPAGDFGVGVSIKEDATRVKDGMEQARALTEKARRTAPQNPDPGRARRGHGASGRPWGALQGVRRGKLGRAAAQPRPCAGRRPHRPLRCGDGCARGARLGCRTTRQKENAHECGVCGKSFGRSRSLARHQRTHAGDKPFRCLDCGQSFNDSSNLGAHQRAHAGEKPSRCAECGQRSTGGAHGRAPGAQSPCGGEDCEQSLSSCARFREHRRTQAGNRPHGCARCSGRLGKSSALSRHREAAGRDRLPPHPPPLCPPEQPRRGKADDLRKQL